MRLKKTVLFFQQKIKHFLDRKTSFLFFHSNGFYMIGISVMKELRNLRKHIWSPFKTVRWAQDYICFYRSKFAHFL